MDLKKGYKFTELLINIKQDLLLNDSTTWICELFWLIFAYVKNEFHIIVNRHHGY